MPEVQFALLTYPEDKTGCNLGDYIQSVAARRLLPRIDRLLNRESLSQFRGPRTKVILNGWFAHNTRAWLPSADIDPLFVSFHVSPKAAPRLLDSRALGYLRNHQPIGCRDTDTLALLRSRGLDAYFSGCLTLTFTPTAEIAMARTEVLLVDPFWNSPFNRPAVAQVRSLVRSAILGTLSREARAWAGFPKLFASQVAKQAASTSHQLPPGSLADSEKFALAEDHLSRYSRARLVITSRLHCALPCLAFSTPIIFINSFEEPGDVSRLSGLSPLLNRIDLMSNGSWKSNFELTAPITADLGLPHRMEFLPLADRLRATVASFLTR